MILKGPIVDDKDLIPNIKINFLTVLISLSLLLTLTRQDIIPREALDLMYMVDPSTSFFMVRCWCSSGFV
jgi:hypothetical protein